MIPIWENEIPYFDPELRQFPPSVTEYLLPGENCPGCLVIPGGGYIKKAWDHEGVQIAEWLNGIGINAFVLDYRVAPYDGKAMFADGLQAMQFVRQNAQRFGTDPNRLGVCGFSAGGHLAGCIAALYQTPLQRPDFAVLCYAVLNFSSDAQTTHLGTARAFLGEKQDDPEEQKRWSLPDRAHKEMPPTFLWTTDTDRSVPPVANTVAMYQALKKCGVETEMIRFDHGAHGLGIPRSDPQIASWADRCAAWLKKIGIL